MIEEQPSNQAAVAAFEMQIWTLVGELAKPLYGHQPIPALMALHFVVAHCLKQTADPDEALELFIGDLRATLPRKPALAN
jgi:hypothetical protein